MALYSVLGICWSVSTRRALRRYATELAANATAISEHDATPPELTFDKFEKLLQSLFGRFHSFVPVGPDKQFPPRIHHDSPIYSRSEGLNCV